MTRLAVRPYAPSDLPGIQALFRRAYGSELTDGEWEWKYGRSPFPHLGVVGERDGAVVAYYGGWRWRLHGSAGTREALVFCDIMTDPAARMAGRLPPLIPLHEAAMALAASEGVPYFCGFPNRGAARFGSRFLGYRYEWMVRCASPIGPLAGVGRGGAAVAISDTFPPSVDALAPLLHALPGFRVERTRAVLNWRYHARPGRYYRVYTVEDGTAARACGVVSTAGPVAVLLDLQSADPDRGEGLGELLAAIAGDLAPRGIEELRAGLTRFSPLLAHLTGRFGFAAGEDENPFGILPTSPDVAVDVSPTNFDARWGDNDVF